MTMTSKVDKIFLSKHAITKYNQWQLIGWDKWSWEPLRVTRTLHVQI
jgi:hypothetical protein